ncbi:hypothetical protein AB2M62_11440 [Sphingomonas sp. MMS12-HWE2-04]|uniref:hypothetical protein n=1 Tax=Sphingomonas sp. MMS12-HWE2-04 TaxID=3234199 RepID=UPI0038511463
MIDFDLAEAQKDGVVEKLDAVVDVVRGFATSAEQEFGGFAGGAVNSGADRIESLASSLREQSVEDIVDGTRSVIARHPVVAIGAASVIGLVAGRIAKAGLAQAAAGAAQSRRAHQTEKAA